MFIVSDNLSFDAALEQADVCLRLAASIGRGNESDVPDALRLLQRVGRPGSVSGLVESALGGYRDSELLPRGGDVLAALESGLPSHEAPAQGERPEAPAHPDDPDDATTDSTRSSPAARSSRRRRRRIGSIL